MSGSKWSRNYSDHDNAGDEHTYTLIHLHIANLFWAQPRPNCLKMHRANDDADDNSNSSSRSSRNSGNQIENATIFLSA